MGQVEEEVPGKGSGGDSAYVSADQTSEPTSYYGSGKSGKGSSYGVEGSGKSGKGSDGGEGKSGKGSIINEPALVEVREVLPLYQLFRLRLSFIPCLTSISCSHDTHAVLQ